MAILESLCTLLPAGQGLYFFLTGVWPLLSMATFIRVTGPKRDLWLVRTVGILITVIGGVLFSAALRGAVTPEIAALAMGSSAGLTAIDVIYVLRKTISPIYLADAAAEVVLLILWTIMLLAP